VGDPFTEKLLIEACLELIRSDLLVAFQDLGAGGISCPTSEMAAKSRSGMKVDIDRVHRREPGMEPFEVMISESQERMMGVVEPLALQQVQEVCTRWGLDCSVIGEVTPSGRLEVTAGGEIVADVPATALADEGPVYERPLERPGWIDELQASEPGDDAPGDIEKALLEVLRSPAIASKRWVWEQYDHMIFLGTIVGPGGDAAVIRLPGREEAVALSTDGPGRYCYLDPFEGARLAVAESARNVACTGARPLAVTNCLNFGNPEKTDVMWQFAETVRGIGDACLALGTPVTGGNVSFYNETAGRAIYPTPVIGMLGAMPDASNALGIAFRGNDDIVLLLGRTNPDDFGGSEYSKVINGVVAGRPPRLDLQAERALHGFLIEGAERGVLRSAHDLSDGGLVVAIAESAAAGGVGLRGDASDLTYRELFSESPSRAVVTCTKQDEGDVRELAERHALPILRLGTTGSRNVELGEVVVPVDVVTIALRDGLSEKLSATID
jgi:phosphoribosylformylglycinamidine synthase